MHFFQLLSAIKENLVSKTKRSTYLSFVLHVGHKKLLILAVFTQLKDQEIII